MARRTTRTAPRPPKQAVVVVHGIGEQRPLETLREFVDTVFQRDLSLTSGDPRDIGEDEIGAPINRVWIVPDEAAGSKELRRITTPSNTNGRRTDFYEFYWADLTLGTPLDMVVDWARGLLLRTPWRIPLRIQVWLAWLLLWVLTILMIGFLLALANPDVWPFADWASAVSGWLRQNRSWLAIPLGIGGAAIAAYRIARTRPRWKIRLILPFCMLVAAIALPLLPDSAFDPNPRLWAGLIGAAMGGLLTGTILPYVGDVVRFVRATPATVASRQAIRERGLALLRELHNKGLDKDGNGRREYDRIILVGHSLGAMVAYDLLQRFWEEAGPNPRNGSALTQPVLDALEAVDRFVAELWHPMRAYPFDLASFRAAQARLHNELVKADRGWLISDLVTLGSPIVHSEFLVADSRAHLDRSLVERMFSASPPRPDLPNNSMIYESDKGPFPHHAAVFSAVRWTNVYDEHWLPLLGDVVSGKVPAIFGPGIEEHRVTIRHGWIPFLDRMFTHTRYWTNTTGKWDDPPEHINTLRAAMRLKG